MDKKIYWTIKITLGILGIIAIFQIVPFFTEQIYIITEITKEYYVKDNLPELKFLITCLSIWITCKVFDTITNIIFKTQKLLDAKLNKGDEKK